ncbi:hypothetical protein BGZ65_002887 [Modicella reniformis]|uniref:Uncharacterized protein n=1 Tax=Modicella reniformis TaxID=1440133 RepID=A0A9P6MLJ0_9FUNG|nr:hypothetical protein BGZ65_002887 [Modicella reniformis]
MNSLLDYKHVGQLISIYNKPLPPTVKPSEFQTDLCAEVLRTDESVKTLLQQIEVAVAQETDRAKLHYDLSESSRLRVPCDAETFLLTFTGIISHAPAAYQRNLIRSRFFFASFPSTELERRIQGVLEQQQQQHGYMSLDMVEADIEGLKKGMVVAADMEREE